MFGHNNPCAGSTEKFYKICFRRIVHKKDDTRNSRRYQQRYFWKMKIIVTVYRRDRQDCITTLNPFFKWDKRQKYRFSFSH